MPPFGLYQYPRNHLYSGPAKPRIYNSNDFQGEPEQAPSSDPAVPPAMNGAREPSSPGGSAKKKAKKDKKRDSLVVDRNSALESIINAVERGNGSAKGKAKKDKKKQRASEEGPREERRGEAKDKKARMSEGGAQEPHSAVKKSRDSQISAQEPHSAAKDKTQKKPAKSTVGGHPNSTKKDKEDKLEDARVVQQRQPAKKRKRDSEARVEQTGSAPSSDYYANLNLPDVVVASLREFNSATKVPQPASKPPEQPLKKRAKRKSQTAAVSGTENSAVNPEPSGEVKASESKVKTTKKGKNERHNGAGDQAKGTPATPKSDRVVVKTSVPLPKVSQGSGLAGSRELKQKPEDTQGRRSSHVLVPETPPSKAPKKTTLHSQGPPLPPPKLRDGGAATEHPSTQGRRRTLLTATPTPAGDAELPATAPAALAKAQGKQTVPSIPNALTSGNLRYIKAPLNSEPKRRRRSTPAASTTSSGPPSSAATMSIKDAFARIGRPHVRPVTEPSPFVTPRDTPTPAKTPPSASPLPSAFPNLYQSALSTVDFAAENAHLDAHLDWDKQHNHGPVPCMGKVTGCSLKKDARFAASNALDHHHPAHSHEEADLEKLLDVAQQAERAEDLLMLATRAHIPIPLGPLAGTWTLFCPRYAAAHVDRYGYGKRTLLVSPVARSRGAETFSATLHLPPRTMGYTIGAVAAPPHASFRAVGVATAESYPLEFVFLGNGYLHVRLDLKLLLTGKTDGGEGRGVMEFIGVHEGATRWAGKDVEDAGDAEDASVVVEDGGSSGE